MAQFKVLSWHLLGETKENQKKTKHAYKLLVVKSLGKRSLRRPRLIQEGIMKVYF
jgi:hypothetical protein